MTPISRLPRGFRFVILRRISPKLCWAYVRLASGGHWFLYRTGGER